MPRILPASLGLVCILLTACTLGYKDWPQPQNAEDRFSWRLVTAERQGACLVIEGRLSGAYQYLSYVTVQLEALGDGAGCVECPFNPSMLRDLARGDSGYEEIGPYVRLVVCDLDPNREYKFRIVGHSSLRSLRPVRSEVMISEP